MNTQIGRISVNWTVKNSTTVDVSVALDGVEIINKALTAAHDTLAWSSAINFVNSKGEIKLRRWSKDQTKYTLLTSFMYESQMDHKSFLGEIGTWN